MQFEFQNDASNRKRLFPAVTTPFLYVFNVQRFPLIFWRGSNQLKTATFEDGSDKPEEAVPKSVSVIRDVRIIVFFSSQLLLWAATD